MLCASRNRVSASDQSGNGIESLMSLIPGLSGSKKKNPIVSKEVIPEAAACSFLPPTKLELDTLIFKVKLWYLANIKFNLKYHTFIEGTFLEPSLCVSLAYSNQVL